MPENRKQRWYFGGLASAGAAICTHPLDLIKVHLQTQQTGKIHIIPAVKQIIRNQGVLALYNGLSASLLRQLTYSTTRFAVYEVSKQHIIATHYKNCDNELLHKEYPLPMYVKLGLASFSGLVGGFVGSPADLINVRMQNDVKLPFEKRRNYVNAFDGLYRVARVEGIPKLFNGVTMAITRGIFMTVGQLAFYDQIKQMLLQYAQRPDNVETHIISSVSASIIATTLTQPLDVLKTRMMNAKPNEYKGIFDCAQKVLQSDAGILGFYKGYIPAFTRLAPHTVLTFVFLEQITKHFGIKTPY